MNNKKNSICKHFVKNSCSQGDNCNFVHEKDICRYYFFDGVCKKDDKCKFKHTYTIIHKKVRNTENFNPSYEPSSMNILVGNSVDSTFYKTTYTLNDVVIVPNFIKDMIDKNEIYNKLLDEIKNSGLDPDKLWKLWHGDNHLIADDNLNWKEKVPTFGMIISEIEKYFHMEVKSTRFNYYQNSKDWKPFHHDAAAVKEHISKNQNFTVGISLGATRDIVFENAKNKTLISIPLLNGTAYAFSKDVNINWKHGIPQIHPDKSFDEGRISIIAWGKVELE